MKCHCVSLGVAAVALAAAGAGLAMRAGAAAESGAAAEATTVAKPAEHPAPAVAASHQFAIDSVHSSVVYSVEHMGVTNFYGAFKDLSGTYTLDDADASRNIFNLTVKTDSIDTRNQKRDDHMRSPDFFSAKEFPEITFKSTNVEKAGERLKVTGDLTLHGVMKPITADMRIWKPKETRQGFKSGFEATFTIKRSDFGMNTAIADGALGDEVTITVAAEGASNAD